MKTIEEMFELIPEYPGLNICLVDDFGLKNSFFKLSNEKEATIYLKNFKKEDIKSKEFVVVERFSFDDKRYNQHSILYDFVFLLIDAKKLELEDVLKKFYRTIKNAGYIYIFAKDDIDDILELLQKINFVSVNIVDDFKEHKIISAQKMHGWMRV